MSLWLLCILTLTLTWVQTNVCTSKQTTNKQTNKQTNMYGHLKRGLKPLISQNHINHNKDTNEVAGAWFAWIFMLIVTGRSLISSMFIDFNDMIRAQYRVDDPSACTTAWHRILLLLMSWPAEHKRHNSTQKNMFFIDSSWALVFICNFSIETLSHILKYCPFPDGIIITSRVSLRELTSLSDGIKHASIITKKREK